MKQFTVAEARNQLPNLLHQVECAGSVQISRRGKPVAVLLSMVEYQKLQRGPKSFGDVMAEFRSRHDLSDMEGVFEGLRDASPGRDLDVFE